MTTIFTKTATTGQEIRISTRNSSGRLLVESYIAGKWAGAADKPELLPQPIVKDGQAYTHHIGSACLTAEEAATVMAALAAERDALATQIASLPVNLFVKKRDEWGEFGPDAAWTSQGDTTRRHYTGHAFQLAFDLVQEKGEKVSLATYCYSSPTDAELAALNAEQDSIEQALKKKQERAESQQAKRDACIATFPRDQRQAWWKYDGDETEASMDDNSWAAAVIARMNKRLKENQ